MGVGKPSAQARLARILEAQSVLARVAATLGPDLDIDEVLASVLTAMRKLLDFKGGTVQLVDERGVYIAASDPPVPDEMKVLRVRVGEGLSGRVVATGGPVWSDDISTDNRVSASMREIGSNLGTRSYLAVPLVCLGETIGALQIDSREVDAFDDDDVTLLEGLAAQMAGVIESARRFVLVMELERLKSDFISRVSHELRTPITIIDGFVMTMLDHGDRLDADARRDMLTRCRTASARLSRLIEELITLARLETGVIQASPAATKMKKLLDDVAMAATDPGAVATKAPDDLTLMIDPELARRALGLLVDNAVKYGDVAEVVVDENGTIEVRDSGPGIADDVKESVFELFTRGRGTTDVPGLGLGLPMARTLITAMGGEMTIADRPGGGTVVRISLR
ncbi:MAG TPA: GAF domain-containing protein [Acidimicrobiales bacterium]|nr:GAF domain-containing protein [Acidimicrobiales bacterium]